jgi:hypothetical protein
MLDSLRPWHVLLASLAGWVNQYQQRADDGKFDILSVFSEIQGSAGREQAAELFYVRPHEIIQPFDLPQWYCQVDAVTGRLAG